MHIYNNTKNLKNNNANFDFQKRRKTKRLSGFNYRQQKSRREEEKLKLAGSMYVFLKKETNPDEETNTEEFSTEMPSTSGTSMQSMDVDIEEEARGSNEEETRDFDSDEKGSELFNKVNLTEISTAQKAEPPAELSHEDEIDVNIISVSDDPGTWPENITSSMAKMLVERGPIQVKNLKYPISESGRKFSENYYYKSLKNGEKIKRDWLVYSISHDAVFCFCCKIFGTSFIGNLNNQIGFSDWHHLSEILGRHEQSVRHNKNVKQWISLIKMLNQKSTVNQMELRLLESEKKYWFNVMERIVSIIQYLSRQCLALRGSSSKLYEPNNGNFLKAVEMIAQFDIVMREHVSRVQKSQESQIHMSHYLGNTIQNEIITLIGMRIKTFILNSIRAAKYYSVILDCTPDVSHTEQITIIFRFVFLNYESKKVEIREHFVGFCPITDCTGEGLSDFLTNLIVQLNLNIYNMRGQGYDNGANMRGKHNGLQKKILDINPRAFFVPCSAHTLNLVVNDAANVSHETTSFFDLVQDLYVFFSASTKRWDVLKRHVPTLTLKPLSDTRWSSRIDALKPLRYQIGNVYDALFEISENLVLYDASTRHKAQALGLKLHDYKVLCAVITWHDILFKVNVLSKMMQSSSLNIKVCVDYLENLIDFFSKMRSDEGYMNVLVGATELANDLEIQTDFPPVHSMRRRRTSRQFDYEHEDEAVRDPKIHFKINFFFKVLDQILSSLSDRFDGLQSYSDIFGFLFKIGDISDQDLMKNCKDMDLKLRDESLNESDIDGSDLYNEIKAFNLHFKESLQREPEDILQFILENSLMATFPNLFVALRIMLTLPVSVATGERSFSKLKIIKNYVRSTMLQERLTNLSLISIEHDILDSLNINDTIQEFAESKTRKVPFL